jgi:hypothetical protein
MAAAVFKIIIKIGRSYFGTNSSKIANDLVKQGGKRVPKTKIPKSADVKRAPTIPNPKSPKTGQFTRAQPPAVKSKTDPKVSGRSSVPKKTTAPKAPAKPKVSNAALKPSAKTKTDRRYRPGDNAKLIGSGRGGSTPRSYKVGPGKTNPVPPKLRSTTAATRMATIEGGPEIDKSSIKPRNTPKTKTDRGPAPKTITRPKKTGKPGGAIPRTAPASGPANNESFGKAFKRNRKAGNATFTWKDKEYTTRFKEETIAQHKKKFGVEGKY